MLRRLISEDIQVITSLDPVLDHVKADAGQVEQILMTRERAGCHAPRRKLTIETANTILMKNMQSHTEVVPGRT